MHYKINFQDIEVKDIWLKKSLFWLLIASRGGETRIAILGLLLRNPLNKNELSKRLNLNYRTVTHHVAILKANNIVNEDQRYGSLIYVNGAIADELRRIIDKLIEGGMK